jgi:hypothetical protein
MIEITGSGGNYIMRSFQICTAHQISLGWSQGELDTRVCD